MKKLILPICCAISFMLSIPAQSQKRPELAKSPPMGWNSWNWFGRQDINEKAVYEVIDAMAENGLRDAGYQYIIIDGGWRDNKLSPDGKLQAHPIKFPNGIKPLADYAHSKGFKFGLHTVPGTHDCGGSPVGGFNKEEIQIKQFVDWGLDFIKLDLCIHDSDPCSTCEKTDKGWSEQLIDETYRKWSRLLHDCNRDILFSISAYNFRDWNPELGNMSRTTFDILSKHNPEGAIFDSENRKNTDYLSVMATAEINNQSAKYAGNGYWNDPDMLVTGGHGLNVEEQISHFCLWAIMSAPLMLGNDPRNLNETEKKLLVNKEIIAIDQDTTEQGKLIVNGNGYQIWKKKLSNGEFALLLLNLNTSENKSIKVDFNELGLPKKVQLRNLVNHKDLGQYTKSFYKELAPHSCSLLKVSN